MGKNRGRETNASGIGGANCDGDGDALDEGDVLALAETLGDRDDEGDVEADGERDEDGDVLADGLTDADADALGDVEAEAETPPPAASRTMIWHHLCCAALVPLASRFALTDAPLLTLL